MSFVPASLAIDDDHRLILDAVREFARAELLPLDRRCDTDESSIVQVLPKLAEMGLLNMCVPMELGGLGLPYRIYAAVIHELAIWSPSTAVTVGVHCLTGNIIDKRMSEPLRSQWLGDWGNPASFAAFALSEAGAGSDAGGTQTVASVTDGGYVLNGEKMWITNGMAARWFLTLVRLKGAPADESLCAVMVDGNTSGVERTKITGKMGIRGSETAVIHLSDAPVPDTHVVGERGAGLKVMLAGLNEGRIGIAAQATGIAQACLDEMVSYARQREQFGRPIGKMQAVANMIADSAVELEAAKALIWKAAAAVDAGRPCPKVSSMAKLYATECANRIAYRAVQVHGGTGYVNECRVEQLYRDARVTTIYEGTSEIQRMVIARELADTGG